MIKIKIKQTEKDCIIEIQGHANYAQKGQDIVCSAISTLYQTLRLSIGRISNADSFEENRIDDVICCIEDCDDTADTLITNFLIGCKAVSEAYPENIRIDATKL